MPASPPSVLVIGATGTVGRRLVPRLADRNVSVRAGTRTPEAYDGPDAATAVRFDYRTPDSWADALTDITHVFMMAPPDLEASPQLVPVLNAAEDAGVGHVVLMTAMGVDQAPDEMPLRRAELALIESDLGTTLLRPNWFMQNFTSVWRGMIEDDGGLRLPAGEGATSLVDAEDIAAVAEAALVHAGHAGAAYTLTGPEALPYHEAAAILADAWNRSVRYTPISDTEAHRRFVDAGLNEDYAEMLIGLFQDVRAGHAASITDAVETVTGRPARSLADFAEAAADEMS